MSSPSPEHFAAVNPVSPGRSGRLILAVLCLAAAVSAYSAGAAVRHSQPEHPRRTLRIAADPNNLPFTNERLEGFENKLAQLIARDLNADVEYVWRAQRRGFFREVFKEGKADIVLAVPAGFAGAGAPGAARTAPLTTRPYYRSCYALASRADRNLDISSSDAPRLKPLRVGLQIVGDDGSQTP